MFYISKIVNTKSLIELVDTLNTNTQDGYIEDQREIGSERWVVRVTCSLRPDAEFIRGFHCIFSEASVG